MQTTVPFLRCIVIACLAALPGCAAPDSDSGGGDSTPDDGAPATDTSNSGEPLSSGPMIYPASTTVPAGGYALPFMGSINGTWSVDNIAGGNATVGTVDAHGTYRSPASGSGAHTIKVTNGTSVATATLSLSGKIEQHACSYGPGLNTCTMQHQEIVGGVHARTYGVWIPPTGFVSCATNPTNCSGMILKINGTTHDVARSCTNGPNGELAGWGPYLKTTPGPVPIIVCWQGWHDTGGTDNGERPNTWGWRQWNWINGVVPDDVNMLLQMVYTITKEAHIDPRNVAVTNDWWQPTSVLGDQFAAAHSELVSAVGMYDDGLFSNVDAARNETKFCGSNCGQHIPDPAGPVSVILLASRITNSGNMCGRTSSHPLTHDDIFNYWNVQNKVQSISYGPSNVGTKLCDGTYTSDGYGNASALEKKVGTGGVMGTEIAIWKFVKNVRGTPWCSPDYNGNNTLVDPLTGYGCGAGGASVMLDLRPQHQPPATSCTWQQPCNHYVDTTTGYSYLGLLYNFFQTHKKK